jgi:hypothetical protein
MIRIITFIPLFLSLLSATTLAYPPRTGVDRGLCLAYDYMNPPEDIIWSKHFDLRNDDSPNDLLSVSRNVKAKTESDAVQDGGKYTVYKYTIHAGISKTNDLHIYAERAVGKGLGQEFKVNLFGTDASRLVSYWINANDRCSIKLPWPASSVVKVTTQWRDTTYRGYASQ